MCLRFGLRGRFEKETRNLLLPDSRAGPSALNDVALSRMLATVPSTRRRGPRLDLDSQPPQREDGDAADDASPFLRPPPG
jgi:hypothetical protein